MNWEFVVFCVNGYMIVRWICMIFILVIFLVFLVCKNVYGLSSFI